MKHRFLGIILTFAITMTLCIFPTIAAEVSFEDTSGHWAEDAIYSVVDKGLFNGTSDTTFSPNVSMTRGMFVTVLGRFVASDGIEVSGKASFSDVADDAYYAPYVGWAAQNGIVKGTSETTFAPDNPVTREQMCALFVRLLEYGNYTVPAGSEMAFTDNSQISSYAKAPVQSALALGLIKGVETANGTAFKPAANATRAEVATVFLRLDVLDGIHDLKPSGDDPAPVDPTPVEPTPVDPTPVDPTPVVEPTEEEKALEAEIAGYLQTILTNYRNMEYIHSTDQIVKDCMRIITNSLQDALSARANGTFLSEEYVKTTYADSISEAKGLYHKMTEAQKSQMDNVAARLAKTSELRKVLDYFGYGDYF